ncbi:glycosyltransferase [Amorphus sp. 3PC139-8]|uniref:glycosyltransferase n=1 Tax=Amorphus sp. 3PC139-8 TaxID=2735676 RepID=UPI00345D6D46
MKFCDLTIAYNETSGGIRTFVDAKRRFLLERTDHCHLLIVPGARDATEETARTTTVTLESPLLPGQDTYRAFVRPDRIMAALKAHAPDIVELASPYLESWAAFAYRDQRRRAGSPSLVGAYFHTDVADAYVGAPLRAAMHDWFDEVSETLSTLGERFADIAETGAEHYIGSVFQHADLAMAASDAQAARLREYDVQDVEIVPLGVDIDLFRPDRRNLELRTRHGAGPDDLVLVYAGRLSAEKHVSTLIRALDHLPAQRKIWLWMMGHGPLRDRLAETARDHPRLRLLSFVVDRTRFAELLASADIYVTAGPHETFGLSVLEAQASGLPVVGVEAGALLERVPPELGRLGPVDDAAAMAGNILAIATERETIGSRARRHVESGFTWEHTFRRWLAAYRRKSVNGRWP